VERQEARIAELEQERERQNELLRHHLGFLPKARLSLKPAGWAVLAVDHIEDLQARIAELESELREAIGKPVVDHKAHLENIEAGEDDLPF